MNFVRDFFVNTTFLFIFCNFACSDNRTRIDRLLTKTEVKTIRLKKNIKNLLYRKVPFKGNLGGKELCLHSNTSPKIRTK